MGSETVVLFHTPGECVEEDCVCNYISCHRWDMEKGPLVLVLMKTMSLLVPQHHIRVD